MKAPIGIPSVDLSDFLSNDEKRKASFVKQIGEAYEEIGFVAVRNHGIEDKVIDQLYTNIKAFFNLPTAVKAKYEIEGIGGQRGYTSFGKEHAKQK